MASKVWVLDTETKGTGAQMVPLESVLEKPRGRPEPLVPPRRPRPRPAPAAEPPAPRRFKVVDISTREVLADDAGARRTLEVLAGVRSVVDVSVHVWEPADERWRLLTQRERRLLWERRG